MFTIKMITFCKNADCPSSQKLLAFQKKKMMANETKAVEAHLIFCEFCESELEFYANYPQSEESVAKVEIPLPLYELAEALLNNKCENFLSLGKLSCEMEGFSLEKA